MAKFNEKNWRSDNTRIIIGNFGDNPKLGAKLLHDGRESLFLDYYFGMNTNGKTQRRREFLKLYLWEKPRNPIEKNENSEIMEQAKEIRHNREKRMKSDRDGLKIQINSKINFLDYFKDYLTNYKQKDIRVMEQAFRRFTDFLNSFQEYRIFSSFLDPKAITEKMMKDFSAYLTTRSKGSGAISIYKRFKKVIIDMVKKKIIADNPCDGISPKYDGTMLVKDVLSAEEIVKLVSYHDKRQSPVIRKAFLFCLYTGLRFCDVKELTFNNIDFENKQLRFTQSKVKETSNHSGVVVPLTDEIISLIGEQRTDELLFKLPSHTMCLKSLRKWVEGAGIKKHITWHCARHSFGANLINNGENIKLVSELLGHSSIKMTEIYTRAFDSQKRNAVESLPKLNLNN